jgi:putative ABC transport system substrate-binding protein
MGDDPIDLGLVASLARPGGNLTGISILTTETAAKRLELLRELLPKVARVAVLANPASAATTEATLREVELAARSIGLQIQVFNANTSREIDAAFESMGRERADALFVATTPFLNARVVQLAQLATFHRLPAIHALREYAEAGGLISYGANIEDACHQAGIYAGRILKGAKPADLPVVQASKFELVINATTARMLGKGDALVSRSGNFSVSQALSDLVRAMKRRHMG